MTDEVTDRLRNMILSRQLSPGRRIRQAELASMLGVSTMPVREALLRLVAEGMVTAEANRSFTVASTTASGIRDIYWMHAVLGGELTARGWDRRSPQLIKTLEGHHKDYLAAAEASDAARLSNANWQFHAAINRLADSPTIASAMRRTLHYFPEFSAGVTGWTDLAGRWQLDVIREFRTGSREGARSVASKNIAEAGELFIESFWSDADRPEDAG